MQGLAGREQSLINNTGDWTGLSFLLVHLLSLPCPHVTRALFRCPAENTEYQTTATAGRKTTLSSLALWKREGFGAQDDLG